jgi:hypothetical protein
MWILPNHSMHSSRRTPSLFSYRQSTLMIDFLQLHSHILIPWGALLPFSGFEPPAMKKGV